VDLDAWLELVRHHIDSTADEQAYIDLIAPTETAQLKTSMAKMSGCALVCRGLLRQAGWSHTVLSRPYRIGRAVSDVVEIAKSASRWATDRFVIGVGDIVLLGRNGYQGETATHKKQRVAQYGGSEHMLTIIDINDNIYTSVDGGCKDVNGTQCIRAREREIMLSPSGIWLGARRVAGVFSDPWRPAT
jgi:hypothetical protein